MHTFEITFPYGYEEAEKDLIALNNYAQARVVLRQMYATKEEAEVVGDELEPDFDLDKDLCYECEKTLNGLLSELEVELDVSVVDEETKEMDPEEEPELPIPDRLKKYGEDVDILLPELLFPSRKWLEEGNTYLDWYQKDWAENRWIDGLYDSRSGLRCESDEDGCQPWDNDQFMDAVALVVSKHPEITKDKPVTIFYEVCDGDGRDGFIQKVWYDEEKKGSDSDLNCF